MGFLRRRLWLILGGLAVAAGLAYAFYPTPVEVDTARVGRGPMQVTVDEDGKTRIKDRYVVSAPLAGQLLRIALKAGDPVRAGETAVATIEPSDPSLLDARSRAESQARVSAAGAAARQAEAAVSQAEEALELARRNTERARAAATRAAVSREELDLASQRERMAREELRAARFAAQVAAFEVELTKAAFVRTRPPSSGEASPERFQIESPVDGAVLRVFQESAAAVAPGTRLLEVGDPVDLEVEVDLLSADAVKVRAGAPAWLEHWGGGPPLRGEVRLVEPAGFTKVSALGVEEQRVWVIIRLLSPPEQRPQLGDAYRVEARIVVWESADVLKVPAGALFRSGGEWAVFAVRDGRARLQKVTVGQNNGLEAEVLGGLAEGDVVVLHPGDRVHDGGRVAPRPGP